MTTRRLVTLIALVAVFVMATRVSLDSDTWWHLRAGQWIVQSGTLLREDPFSLTRAGAPWHYPGWLAQVILYEAYRLAGYAGLNLLVSATVTLAFALVLLSTRGDVFLRAFVLVLAATASGIYWSARPQIFSLALAAAFVWVLEAYRWRGQNLLWLLPPLMALWVNLHGGFAIGFILLALAFLGEALDLLIGRRGEGTVGRRGLGWLALAAGGCVLAVGINPFGYEMLTYPLKTVAIRVLQDFIQEWQSPNFHMREAQPFLVLLFVCFASVGFSRLRLDVTDFLLVAGLGWMGFLAGRNMPLLSLVAPPVIVRHAQEILGRVAPRWGKGAREMPAGKAANLGLLLLVLFAGVVKIVPVLLPAENERALEAQEPTAAVAFLKSQPGMGNLFNSYNWGGYLIWSLPEYPVFVDGRTDLYDDALLSDYLAVYRGDPRAMDILDRWRVNVVLLEPEAPLVGVLKQSGWAPAFADARSVVLLRGGTVHP